MSNEAPQCDRFRRASSLFLGGTGVVWKFLTVGSDSVFFSRMFPNVAHLDSFQRRMYWMLYGWTRYCETLQSVVT